MVFRKLDQTSSLLPGVDVLSLASADNTLNGISPFS